jgi:leucyl/phenylalanyl-tRNA--protein transferase
MKDDATPPISSRLLLQAYAAGVFPMADSATASDIFWVDPKLRGILPLDAFHVPRSLRRRMLRGPSFNVTVDRAFAGVLDGCADRADTWINPEIRRLYLDLHRLGHAHSIEVSMDGMLAGGLYGVALGGAFFGESMFSRQPDASKIALVHLVARLRAGGFVLLDTQFVTTHLAQFGATEISRAAYHKLLGAALGVAGNFWALPEGASSHSALQLSTQTS